MDVPLTCACPPAWPARCPAGPYFAALKAQMGSAADPDAARMRLYALAYTRSALMTAAGELYRQSALSTIQQGVSNDAASQGGPAFVRPLRVADGVGATVSPPTRLCVVLRLPPLASTMMVQHHYHHHHHRHHHHHPHRRLHLGTACVHAMAAMHACMKDAAVLPLPWMPLPACTRVGWRGLSIQNMQRRSAPRPALPYTHTCRRTFVQSPICQC